MTAELHPVAAELAAAMVRSPDKKKLALPVTAIDKCRAQLRALDDHEIVSHLIALSVRVRRIAGDGGMLVVAAIYAIVLESVGAESATHDLFADAGLDRAALLATTSVVRAPRAPETRGLAVKPRRGLSPALRTG